MRIARQERGVGNLIGVEVMQSPIAVGCVSLQVVSMMRDELVG